MKSIVAAGFALAAVLLASSSASALCPPICAVYADPNDAWMGCATPEGPVTPTFTPTSFSTDTASTTPGFAGVSGGNMSNGIEAFGARVASKGFAAADKSSWCNRDGRSQANVDACLKLASH